MSNENVGLDGTGSGKRRRRTDRGVSAYATTRPLKADDNETASAIFVSNNSLPPTSPHHHHHHKRSTSGTPTDPADTPPLLKRYSPGMNNSSSNSKNKSHPILSIQEEDEEQMQQQQLPHSDPLTRAKKHKRTKSKKKNGHNNSTKRATINGATLRSWRSFREAPVSPSGLNDDGANVSAESRVLLWEKAQIVDNTEPNGNSKTRSHLVFAKDDRAGASAADDQNDNDDGDDAGYDRNKAPSYSTIVGLALSPRATESQAYVKTRIKSSKKSKGGSKRQQHKKKKSVGKQGHNDSTTTALSTSPTATSATNTPTSSLHVTPTTTPTRTIKKMSPKGLRIPLEKLRDEAGNSSDEDDDANDDHHHHHDDENEANNSHDSPYKAPLSPSSRAVGRKRNANSSNAESWKKRRVQTLHTLAKQGDIAAFKSEVALPKEEGGGWQCAIWRDSEGRTVLHHAADSGQVKFMAAILAMAPQFSAARLAEIDEAQQQAEEQKLSMDDDYSDRDGSVSPSTTTISNPDGSHVAPYKKKKKKKSKKKDKKSPRKPDENTKNQLDSNGKYNSNSKNSSKGSQDNGDDQSDSKIGGLVKSQSWRESDAQKKVRDGISFTEVDDGGDSDAEGGKVKKLRKTHPNYHKKSKSTSATKKPKETKAEKKEREKREKEQKKKDKESSKERSRQRAFTELPKADVGEVERGKKSIKRQRDRSRSRSRSRSRGRNQGSISKQDPQGFKGDSIGDEDKLLLLNADLADSQRTKRGKLSEVVMRLVTPRTHTNSADPELPSETAKGLAEQTSPATINSSPIGTKNHQDEEELSHPEAFDMNVQDNHGRTALLIACRKGQTEMIELLLSFPKCNASLRNWRGDTSLHQLIVHFPSSSDAKNKDYYWKMHHYSQAGMQLISKGCDPLATNKHGNTALHLAAMHGSPTAVRFLIGRWSSNVDQANKSTDTALHLAVRAGCIETVTILLESGATECVSSKYGTPLEIARQVSHHDIARLLSRRMSSVGKRGSRVMSMLLNRSDFEDSSTPGNNTNSPPPSRRNRLSVDEEQEPPTGASSYTANDTSVKLPRTIEPKPSEVGTNAKFSKSTAIIPAVDPLEPLPSLGSKQSAASKPVTPSLSTSTFTPVDKSSTNELSRVYQSIKSGQPPPPLTFSLYSSDQSPTGSQSPSPVSSPAKPEVTVLKASQIEQLIPVNPSEPVVPSSLDDRVPPAESTITNSPTLTALSKTTTAEPTTLKVSYDTATHAIPPTHTNTAATVASPPGSVTQASTPGSPPSPSVVPISAVPASLVPRQSRAGTLPRSPHYRSLNVPASIPASPLAAYSSSTTGNGNTTVQAASSDQFAPIKITFGNRPQSGTVSAVPSNQQRRTIIAPTSYTPPTPVPVVTTGVSVRVGATARRDLSATSSASTPNHYPQHQQHYHAPHTTTTPPSYRPHTQQTPSTSSSPFGPSRSHVMIREDSRILAEREHKRRIQEISAWLDSLVLPQEYLGLLVNEGFEDLETIKMVSEKDLVDIGIDKLGHRRKILRWVMCNPVKN
eukprot:TRINITY_DN2736_c0_g1_i1.p1 TRINITY_DN2736_c0_g1~~TRINITY_DN2736_c0_g1_i1.p1  ORF type:complete len:1531 (-),score=303.15 TRINITY_DN2736_c0_g1_i1:66-4658(-)